MARHSTQDRRRHAERAESRYKARVVKSGETYPSIAKELFGDPRVACLLEDLNPEAQLGARLVVEGQALRIPDRVEVRRWAARLGLTLPHDPGQGGGTTIKRRWQSFLGAVRQLGPRRAAQRSVHRIRAGLADADPGATQTVTVYQAHLTGTAASVTHRVDDGGDTDATWDRTDPDVAPGASSQ